MAYTKLHQSILTSTIWLEDDTTRLVWITLLAMTDRHGEVQGSVPGLAHTARVSVAACRKALATLLAPDPDSRTPDDEGRRIVEIPGGWQLLNHEKYRLESSKDDKAAKAAERSRRYRERKAAKSSVTKRDGALPVTQERDIADTDTDSDGGAPKGRTPIDVETESLGSARASGLRRRTHDTGSIVKNLAERFRK